MDKYSEGSVRKRETKDAKGKTVTRWRGYLRYKQGKKWKQVTKCFGSDVRTEAQARKALRLWRGKMEAEAAAPETESMSVPDYVDEYINSLRHKVQSSTIKGYISLARRIRAEFDGVALGELKAKQIDRWLTKMHTAGLSLSTQRKAYILLNSACKYAVKNEELRKNPCWKVDKPSTPEPRKNAMTADNVRTLKAITSSMEATPLVTAICLALFMGMREGEICALQWRDVDLTTKQINIRQNIGQGERGNYTYLKAPKSRLSKRTIKLTVPALSMLEKRRAYVASELKKADVEATAENMADLFVIGHMDGRYKDPNSLGREWRALAAGLNLKGSNDELCTFHDLRHTYATIVKSGIDGKTLQTVMGHGSITTTMDIYTETTDADKQRAADEASALFDAI